MLGTFWEYAFIIGTGDDMLEKLDGIDVELGMSYCMDDENFYREVLEEYVNSDKSDELEKLFDAGDWENYRIRIHAVKSTSLTIGAKALHEEALELENACKAADIDTILDLHGCCMMDYREILDKIREALKA